MAFLAPLAIVAYFFKDNISLFLKRFSPFVAFIFSGVIFGLITEFLAIIENLNISSDQKVLLSAHPLNDILFGFAYYFSVMIVWYFLLKRYKYSKKEVFLITGIYGVFVERSGQVLIGIFNAPIIGTLYALIIIFVYGLFPSLALMITEGRFKGNKESYLKKYVFGFIALFIQWVVFGIIFLPVLKLAFGS
jgi:hypothetical protein